MAHNFAPVERFIESLIAEIPLAGASLLIAQGEAVIYERAFGAYDLSLRLPIASASKWLGAAVIASLLDDGTLHLDERTSDYVESFDDDKSSITLRQLLAHTSGLPKGEAPCVDQPDATLAECADAIARLPLDAAPGTAFAYGENSFQVAARMTEVATGKSWDDLFLERMAAPLGLTATDYGLRSREPGYVRVSNPRIGSGLRSTLGDYGRFARMIANRGVIEGRRVLREETVALMADDHTLGAPVAFSPNLLTPHGYGLGCWRDRVDKQGRALQLSSPGAYGFTPWVDVGLGLAGVLLVRNTYGRMAAPTRELQRLVREVASVS
jgi:CubicO group peptidase (beta-lactamase class C family)